MCLSFSSSLGSFSLARHPLFAALAHIAPMEHFCSTCDYLQNNYYVTISNLERERDNPLHGRKRPSLIHTFAFIYSFIHSFNQRAKMAAPLPTTADGYIDTAAQETKDTLEQRIWDIDEQLSDVDSIDDDSDFSEFSTTSSTDTRDIQREWDENMEQGRQLFAMVIFPFVGRWIGKKMSYWG